MNLHFLKWFNLLINFFIIFKCLNASYCGQAAIPYSLEILSNGQPVLGCARPSCFGWAANGKRSADAAQFYKINKHADGFLRPFDKKNLIVNEIDFQQQYSICDQSYISTHCSGASWVGGIAPLAKIEPSNSMRLMCCYYNKLSNNNSELNNAEVRPGQIITGGEILEVNNRTTNFEYIGNIQRLFDQNGVVYIVTIKSFPCLPEPTQITTEVNVKEEAKHLFATPQLFVDSKKQFSDQKFELLDTMPQEDEQFSSVNDDTLFLKKENENNFTNVETVTSAGIPRAKVMREENILSKHNNAFSSKTFSAPTKNIVDSNKIDDSNNAVTINSKPNYNYNAYSQQQYQKQHNQQQQYLQPSLFDLLGWFSQSQPFNNNNYQQYNQQPQQAYQQQQFIQQPQQASQQQQFIQQPQQASQQQQFIQQQYNNGLTADKNNNVIQNQRTELVDNNLFYIQTLPPITLAPNYRLPQPIDNEQKPKSLLPSSPLINIPDPDDVEKAIPPYSRKLINNVVRTVFSYFE